MLKPKLSGGAALTVLSFALSGAFTGAFAQDTSSSLRGTVTDDAGAPIAGAEVVITHGPSGTRSVERTGADGVFDARGLRVGGPYSVTFSAADYTGETVQNVFLNLGQTARLNVDLEASMGEIVVVAAPPGRGMGPGATRYDANDINAIAAVRRDIRDIARRDPRVTLDVTNQNQAAPQIAGNNNRFNTLTVDGVAFEDDFGLNASGLPTQRSPITLEAIEQLTISTTPFDVTNGQFLGGAINVVTRGGGADFRGSLSYQMGDSEHLAASRVPVLRLPGEPQRETGVDFSNETWVATLSGPIVPDRLFFFVSYEDFSGDFANLLGPVADDPNDPVYFQTPAGVFDNEVSTVLSTLSSVYGYDSAGLAQSFDELDEKLFIRFDWNITDDHRAVLTYTDATTVDPRTGSSGNHSGSGNTLSLRDNFYNTNEEVGTTALIVYSDWTDSFSTEFAVSWREKINDQAPVAGPETGQFDICTAIDITANPARSCASSDGRLFAGTDPSRQANALETSGYNVRLTGQYTLGAHQLLAGVEYDRQDILNVFIQNAEGSWVFRSLDAFAARDAFSVSFQAACLPGAGGLPDATTCTSDESVAAADWGFDTWSLYLQDTWDITDTLTLTAGLRYDTYTSDGVTFENPVFVARNGFSNAQQLENLDLVSPRLSLEWRPSEPLRFYAGTGLFGGGAPNVWLSNNYQNDGLRILSVSFNRSNANAAGIGILNNADILDESQLLDYLRDPANGIVVSDSVTINALDPDFEVPSTWRYVLGGEARVSPWEGHTFRARAEVMYAQVENALTYVDLRLEQPGARSTETFVDGRPVFLRTSTGRDLVLTNTGEGDATVVTVDFGWEMENGLTFDLGYAYQDATEVNPMTSSVANSNFTNRAVFDPNDEENSRSNYETEDRFTFGATWRREFVPGFQTLFSLFGEHRSGTPFSYTFFDVNNGTATQVSAAGFSARGLMYVPTGPSDPNVSYQASGSQTADQARDLLEQIINSSVLAGYRGTYAARNIGTSPDITTFDFRFSQELPGFFDGHRSIFFFDIENVGNLINPDWGLIEYPSFPRTATVADVVRGPQNADGEYTYIYRNVREPGFDQCPEVNNCRAAGFWQIQVGLRYQF